MLDEHGRMKRREKGTGEAGAEAPGNEPLPLPNAYARRYADPAFWRAIVRKRRLAALGVAAILVAVLAVGALAWIAVVWPNLGRTSSRAEGLGTHIPGGGSPGPSSPSTSVPSTAATDAGPVPSPAGGEPARREPFVAYRRDGAIWIVNESGQGARRVLTSGSGVFSLSPDASRIAMVGGSDGRLAIVDAATGQRKDMGPASDVRPEWSPDSQWLLFSRSEGTADEVIRVAAGGYGETVLLRGVKGRFVGGPDLAVAAPPRSTLPSQIVAVLSDGRTVRVAQRVRSVEVCPGPQGVYVADAGEGTTPPSIRYVSYDGSADLTLVSSPAAGTAVTFSGLSVSPDGKWLVFTETRDDGYSRMFSRQASGIKVIPLKTHRDSYLVGWSADGTEILRIEGNAAQGETTRLTALHPDGTGWRVVVEGAGL